LLFGRRSDPAAVFLGGRRRARRAKRHCDLARPAGDGL